MRIPSFPGTAPHVKDYVIALNGGRFNVDLYLRVLREKTMYDLETPQATLVSLSPPTIDQPTP
jgi:hypothetical protein